jgi:hypothetical protein
MIETSKITSFSNFGGFQSPKGEKNNNRQHHISKLGFQCVAIKHRRLIQDLPKFP